VESFEGERDGSESTHVLIKDLIFWRVLWRHRSCGMPSSMTKLGQIYIVIKILGRSKYLFASFP
jgi:hypothetical protein